MFQGLIETLKSNASNDTATNANNLRTTPRRYTDKCVVGVDGKIMPVKDWSLGGFLATADARLYSVGQQVEFVLKFKIREMILDIPHVGTVVRKSNEKIAVEFKPLNSIVRRRFQRIIDDSIADEFATSQA